MPTASGQESLMEAILAKKVRSFQMGVKGKEFDKPLKSMVDGSMHTNMSDYKEHLKRNDCEVVDANENDSAFTEKKEAPREKFTLDNKAKQMFSEAL